MPVEVILPRVDMDMTQAKLTHWFASEGETVAKGQPLFEIETDKAAREVEAPASGVLRQVAGEAGQTLPIGTVIGSIYAAGEALVEAPAFAPTPPAAQQPTAPSVLAETQPVALATGFRATPKARRLARESGVDLARVAGSGPLGRVQARDVSAPRRGDGLHREWLARGPRPPLVLIHGFGGDLNVWRRWIGRFPSGRGALALDLPGHGRSALGEVIEIEAFAAALAHALAEEGVGYAHIVAHSLGAAVAAALAASNPELVGSLTLIAPAGLGPDLNGAFVSGFLAARAKESLAPWLAELAVNPEALGSGLAEITLRQRRDLGVGVSQAKVAAALLPDGAQVYNARAALAAYRGPVKAIFGREDRIVPIRHARGLPGNVATHVLANVGHMPHLEARDLVARLARENAAAGDEA